MRADIYFAVLIYGSQYLITRITPLYDLLENFIIIFNPGKT